MIKIIADSGSTKTDWLIITDNQELNINTIGLNPVFMSEEEISNIFKNEVLPNLPEDDKIDLYYYGTSCSSPERIAIVKNAFQVHIPKANIQVEHDLLGAARAACGRSEGIACIMGTGSNSCHYDGEKIVQNIGGHGYILGDEGSGANIGKTLMSLYMENQLPPSIKEKLEKEFNLNRNEVLVRVYKSPKPNRFLAQFAPFVYQHEQLHYIAQYSIETFVEKHILKYDSKLPVNIVGSTAHFFRPIVKDLLELYGYELNQITRKPIEGLKAYHS